MDILYNLFLIIPMMWFFYNLNNTKNTFVYVGILILSCLGLLISVFSTAYLGTGNYTYQERILTQIIIDFGAWSYILTLFYLSSLLGIIVFWATDE